MLVNNIDCDIVLGLCQPKGGAARSEDDRIGFCDLQATERIPVPGYACNIYTQTARQLAVKFLLKEGFKWVLIAV